MVLRIERRRIYGAVLHYPVGWLSEEVCLLTGKKTLTEPQIKAFHSLGITLDITDKV